MAVNKRRLSDIQLQILNNAKKELLDQMQDITDEIVDLQNDLLVNYRRIDKLSVQVSSLKSQLTQLDQQINDVTARVDDTDLLKKDEKLSKSSKKYEENVVDLDKLQQEKQDLEKLRDSRKSFIIKRYYQKKINKNDKKIEKLQGKQNKLVDKQRTMIMSKQFINEKRNQKVSYQEALRDNYKILEQEAKDSKKDLLQNGGIFSGIRTRIYDIKINKYKKSYKKANDKLKKMSKGKVSLKSTRVLVWAKNRVNAQRNIGYKNGVPYLAV